MLALILGALIVSLAAVLGVWAHFYLKEKFSFWERRGLKGPKPWPIFGNSPDLIFTRDYNKLQRDWMKEHGKVYGIYKGISPVLVIADPEVLVQLCVKDFEKFPNHDNHRLLLGKISREFLFNKVDSPWKTHRAMLNSTFTSSRVKRMFKLLDGCSDDLVAGAKDQLKVCVKKGIDLWNYFGLYTLDGVSTCCFGLKLERKEAKNSKAQISRNELLRITALIFEFSYLRRFLFFSIPHSILRKFGFEQLPDANIKPLADKLELLVKQRQKKEKKPDDFLQLLIDAKSSDVIEYNEMDAKEQHHVGMTEEMLRNEQQEMMNAADKDKISFTQEEVISHAVFMMVGGTETTAAMLTDTIYLLAFHPEIQQRLYDEIMKIQVDGKFSYEDITSCKYLDAVASESLRMLPPLVMVERQAKEDYHLKKYNLDIPKDCFLNLSLYSINNDEDSWPEPAKFDPDRFMPENKDKIKQGSYCTFGIGPRHCLGMRFSLTESKLGLAKLVYNFRFVPGKNEKYRIKITVPFEFTRLDFGQIHFIPRDHSKKGE